MSAACLANFIMISNVGFHYAMPQIPRIEWQGNFFFVIDS